MFRKFMNAFCSPWGKDGAEALRSARTVGRPETVFCDCILSDFYGTGRLNEGL